MGPLATRSLCRTRPGKKNWPRKKRMASWARQRQQITEAADGGARARTGADGAVVLNLRRGPGAYALLSRADGQLTRAGQHYYSHLGLAAPQQGLPLIREGPNDYILLRNGQKKLVRSLQGGEHRLTKLLPRQVLRVPGPRAGDRPWQAAQRAERRRGLRAQGLAAGEQAGRRNKAPGAPHGGAGGAAGQATSGGLARPGRPHPAALGQDLRALGGRTRTKVETLLQGPEERELPAALREDVLQSAFEDKPLCVPRQLAELLQLSVEEVCADFDAMLRHDWRRPASPQRRCESSACGATRPCATLWTATTRREGAPHRVLLGLRRALLHAQGRKEGAGEAGGARALPGRGEGPCRPSKSGGASTPRMCSRGCSGARTCGRRGASSWPPARAPRWPSAARRSTG